MLSGRLLQLPLLFLPSSAASLLVVSLLLLTDGLVGGALGQNNAAAGGGQNTVLLQSGNAPIMGQPASPGGNVPMQSAGGLGQPVPPGGGVQGTGFGQTNSVGGDPTGGTLQITKDVPFRVNMGSTEGYYFHRILFTGNPKKYLDSAEMVMMHRNCWWYKPLATGLPWDEKNLRKFTPSVNILTNFHVPRTSPYEPYQYTLDLGDRLLTFCGIDKPTEIGIETQLSKDFISPADSVGLWYKQLGFQVSYERRMTCPLLPGSHIFDCVNTPTVTQYYEENYDPRNGMGSKEWGKEGYGRSPPIEKGYRPIDVLKARCAEEVGHMRRMYFLKDNATFALISAISGEVIRHPGLESLSVYDYTPENVKTWLTASRPGYEQLQLRTVTSAQVINVKFKFADQTFNEKDKTINHKRIEKYSISLINVRCEDETGQPYGCENRGLGVVASPDIKFCYPLLNSFFVFGEDVDNMLGTVRPAPKPVSAAGWTSTALVFVVVAGVALEMVVV